MLKKLLNKFRENKDPKMELLLFDTYLTVIKNSTSSRLFRHFYAEIEGKKTDILGNGENSCAFYVTSILKLFNMINEIHTTVPNTMNALLAEGWLQVNVTDMLPGDVLIWDWNGQHGHIGFYIGNNMAISNSSIKKSPKKHSWNYEGQRNVVTVYRHKRNGK